MSRALFILAILAAVLSGVIAFELFGYESSPETTARVAPAREPPGAPSGEEARSVSIILARPLFRADRRPSPADARSVQAGQPIDLPRLTGITVSADSRHAIFQPAGNARAIVVGEGEMVDGWRVQEITADSVTVAGAGGTRKLEPKFAVATGSPGTSSFAPAQNPVNNANQPTPPASGAAARARPPSMPARAARPGDQ
jgi:hypothetical protein